MRVLIACLFICAPLLQCATIKKPDFQSAIPEIQTKRKGRLLNELREIAQAGVTLSRENFQFISQKLKDSLDRYKVLKTQVKKLEFKLDELKEKIKKGNQASKIINLEPMTIEMNESLIEDSKKENVKKETVSVESPLPSSNEDARAPSSQENTKTSLPLSSQKFAEEQKLIFKEAEVLFIEKKWESAIAKFENYRRKSSKKDPDYTRATLRIGQSFTNLKLKEEAQVFFSELITSYPDSEEAKEAKSFLN